MTTDRHVNDAFISSNEGANVQRTGIQSDSTLLSFADMFKDKNLRRPLRFRRCETKIMSLVLMSPSLWKLSMRYALDLLIHCHHPLGKVCFTNGYA